MSNISELLLQMKWLPVSPGWEGQVDDGDADQDRAQHKPAAGRGQHKPKRVRDSRDDLAGRDR
jgi:hypothetical protein